MERLADRGGGAGTVVEFAGAVLTVPAAIAAALVLDVAPALLAELCERWRLAAPTISMPS